MGETERFMVVLIVSVAIYRCSNAKILLLVY